MQVTSWYNTLIQNLVLLLLSVEQVHLSISVMKCQEHPTDRQEEHTQEKGRWGKEPRATLHRAAEPGRTTFPGYSVG